MDYDGWGSESDSGIGLNLLGGMRWPNHLGLEAMLELVEISNVEFGGLHLRAVYTF